MDDLFLDDKFTKSNYQFVNRNQSEENELSIKKKRKIDQMHNDCKNQLLTFHETFSFELKMPNEELHSQINLDEVNVEEFFSNNLIKLYVKNVRNQDKLASESPYKWFLLDADEVRYSIACLDDQLSKEGFFEKPVDWLIYRGIVLPSKCLKCKNSHDKYELIDDEYHWICSNEECQKKKMEVNDNLSFASRILEDIPLLIYNWAVYGNPGLFRKPATSTNVDSNMTRLVICAIRQICEKTNESYIRRLGKNGRMVELFTSLSSGLIVVFAYEHDTTHVKFKILDTGEAAMIISTFQEWFDPSVKLVFYEDKFEFVQNYFVNAERRKFEPETSVFLETVFSTIARNVVESLFERDIFTTLIHEIIWRHLFGKTPYSAFQFIISLILKQPLEYESYLLDLVSKADTDLLVDEIYYGTYDQIFKQKVDPDAQPRNNIRCHKCFIPHNFLSLSNHLMSHFSTENKKTEKKLNAIDTTCHHCFTKFRYTELQLHRDLLDGNLKRKNLVSACKICCKIFKTKKEYIDHLKSFHRYQDHPYSCDFCPFRSSFYHEKLSHYKTNHADVLKAYCKHCLMVFTSEKASTELFEHYKLHFVAKVKFKCEHCALSFVDYQSYKDHFQRDHIIQSKRSINFTINRFKPFLDEEEESVKIRVPKSLSTDKAKIRRLTRDGRKVILTKKNFLKLKYEDLQHDNILNKDFIIINNSLVICLECSRPMDTNHLTKKPAKCQNCDFLGHCTIALKYPCGLHTSGLVFS